MAEYVRDTFSRTAGNWGSATTIGGAYTEDLQAGSTSGTHGSWGRLTGAGGAARTDERLAAATAALNVAGALHIYTNASWLAAEIQTLYLRVATGSTLPLPTGYFGRATFNVGGSITLAIGYAAAGVETVLATATYPAGSWTTGQQWLLEVQANGAPTKLRARIYRPAAGIPSGSTGWLIAGDDVGPQVAGVYQVRAQKLTGAGAHVNDFDFFYVTDYTQPAFTYTATNLAASFSSAPSTGDYTALSWDWGDGTAAGSGTAPSHTYAGAGTYLVKLTGTTRWGSTFVGQGLVTVAAAPPEPPELMPEVLIGGVNVCDDVYGITWNAGRDHWADAFGGQTCTVRLRGQYPATQGMPLSVARPTGTSGAPLWSGVVDQVVESLELATRAYTTLVTAMDTPSFLGRWHMPPGTLLPATSGLAPRLLDLAPVPTVIYRAKWSGVPGSRFPALKKKTQAADNLRARTFLDLIRDALNASIAFAYQARNGDIVYGPWDAPSGVGSTPDIDLDAGIDCASHVELDRNSLEGIVNRWTVGSGDVLDIERRASIEAYGERAFTVTADTLSSATGLPVTDGMLAAMKEPVRSASAEVIVTDWAQDAINIEPLDLALCRGTLMQVMGVRHEITLSGWRVTLSLDRNTWAVDGRAIP